MLNKRRMSNIQGGEMEWGNTQDNIRYPRGLILILPFRVHIKDGIPDQRQLEFPANDN